MPSDSNQSIRIRVIQKGQLRDARTIPDTSASVWRQCGHFGLMRCRIHHWQKPMPATCRTIGHSMAAICMPVAGENLELPYTRQITKSATPAGREPMMQQSPPRLAHNRPCSRNQLTVSGFSAACHGGRGGGSARTCAPHFEQFPVIHGKGPSSIAARHWLQWQRLSSASRRRAPPIHIPSTQCGSSQVACLDGAWPQTGSRGPL